MSGELLRPTFELNIERDAPSVAAQLGEALRRNEASIRTRWARGERHALLTITRERRRWWSPWLHLDVRAAPDGEQGALVLGRFTPNPGLWTAYVLALIALLAVALFGVALGLSQITLERSAWGWWIVLGALAVAAGLILGSRIAQKLAGGQMRELRGAVEDGLAA